MQLTTVLRVLQEDYPEIIYDVAGDYGEPGYSKEGHEVVVMGDYWCRRAECKGGDLHSFDRHYPRVAAFLSDHAMLEWHDEWYVDHAYDKCYRVTGDSYSWQSCLLWRDGDEPLTPDDPIGDWIAECVDNPRRCIPSRVWSEADLAAEGFTEYQCQYQTGWHPGQDADPVAITAEIRRWHGDDVEILFLLTDTGQFDITYCALIRTTTVGKARAIGEEHGANAASWMPNDADYEAVHAGVEDGDPAVCDQLPAADLSGQWADGYTVAQLADDLNLGDEYRSGRMELDAEITAYEEGFAAAVERYVYERMIEQRRSESESRS